MTVSVSDLRPGPSNPNIYLDVLIYDRWVFRPGYVITYVLQGAPGDLAPGGGTAWASAGAAGAFRQAVATWTTVANVRIEEVAFGFDGTTARPPGLTWVEKLEDLPGFAGEHALPGPGALEGSFNNRLAMWNELSLTPGGSMFSTFVHEIGHGLGLKHPHPDSFDAKAFPGVTGSDSLGDNELNDSLYTVMSYNDYAARGPNSNYGWVLTPMAFDIAAVQAIYGPNLATAAGNDFYRLPDRNQPGTGYAALWDAGGSDTIAAQGFTGAIIDLRPATLRNEPGGGGFLSRTFGINGGFTIAAGVVIENAEGASGNDRITGNDVANRLWGNTGDDILRGGPGDDLLIGDRGADELYGEDGDDTILWEVLLDGETNTSSRDTIDGGPGFDTIDGRDSRGVALAIDLNSPRIRSIERVIGGHGWDELTGTAVAETLEGGFGNDVINGGDGDDIIEGGPGANLNNESDDDRLLGGGGDDLIRPGSGRDVVDGGAGFDTVDWSKRDRAIIISMGPSTVTAVERLVGTAFEDRITGDAAGQRIEGGAGDDWLDPGADGSDSLDGGPGFDTLVFAARARPLIIDLSVGAAWDGLVGMSFTGFERVAGSPHADRLFGSQALGDWFLWSGGADSFEGGGGANTLDFSNAPRPVIIDYDVRATWDGEATATFDGFQRIIGSAFADSLFGSETLGEVFEWSPGADTAYGGGGFDILSFVLAPAAVVVDFNEGLAFDGTSLDHFSAVEGAVGSAFSDMLFGSETGNDLFDGGPDGADYLYGGGGVDTASWASNVRGVIIDLAEGAAWDGVYRDTFLGLEDIVGSAFDDVIFGDAGPSTIDGGPGGRDRLYGGPGDDWFVVRPGDEGDLILDFTGGLAGDRILLADFDPAFTAVLQPDGQTWRIEALGGAQVALVTILGPVLPTDWVVG